MMSAISEQCGNSQKKSTYIVGIGVTHTIAPAMHNFINRSLGLPWTFSAVECPKVEDALKLFHDPTFAGAVVTMPYKQRIMSYLDELDDLALKLGACNNVYLTSNRKLRGTNTDWRGVKGCLENASTAGKGQPSLIIGAGGAARAAVYALSEALQCRKIYVINRDDQEVASLLKDAQRLATNGDGPEIIHIKSVEHARGFASPYYIVGTVPDFEPQTAEEKAGRDILHMFLATSTTKGVLLDMCFKPRRTRHIELAKSLGWETVEGIEIIGHQIGEQYRLWAGEEASKRLPQESAWKVLRDAADESKAINF